MKNILPLYIITLVVISCTSSHKDNIAYATQEPIEEILIQPKEGKEIYLSKIIDSIGYVQLETAEGHFVKTIEKIIPFKNFYYIQDRDRKSIFIYGKNGSFVGEIKSVGKGPGEYYKIDDFIIDPHEEVLEVYNRRQQKIFKFNLSGEFIKEVRSGLLATAFTKLDSNKYLFYNFTSKYYPYNLTIADENGEIFNQFFYGDIIKDHVMGLTHYFSNEVNHLSFLKWPGDTIYNVTLNKISPKYHINFNGFESEVHYFTENMEYFTFMFPYDGKKAFTAFYDKKNRSLITTDKMINDINGVPFLKPIATDGNNFISVGNAFAFKSEFFKKHEMLKTYIPEKKLMKVYEFVKDIKENDNPILIISRFKPFI